MNKLCGVIVIGLFSVLYLLFGYFPSKAGDDGTVGIDECTSRTMSLVPEEAWGAMFFKLVIPLGCSPESRNAILSNLDQRATEGDPSALYLLSNISIQGYQRDQDVLSGRILLEESAKGGYLPAQLAMAAMFKNAGDLEPYAFWSLRAAESGDRYSQFITGINLKNGFGVSKNLQMAVHWIRLSAEEGYPNAQTMLGTLYFDGDGVPQDFRTAAEWLLRAANQGEPHAQTMFASMYMDGIGVPQDYVQAHMWANLAAAQGDNTVARSMRDSLAQRMTSGQVAEAQKRAASWEREREDHWIVIDSE